MILSGTSVTLFGGTGFIGRQIIRRLAKQGAVIRVACRQPESAYALRTAGAVGQIVPVACDISDVASIRKAIHGSKIVINCVGILFEKGRQTFQSLHTDFPAKLAKCCVEENVERMIHLSALGIDHSKSNYAKTKRAGENALRSTFPTVTILRPSVVFGAEDNFFNQFATLARYLPFLPLIGGGKTLFQPVYVDDIAQAVIAAIEDSTTQGQVFELGGPEQLNFKDIYTRLFAQTQNPKCLVPIPFVLAKIKGAFFQLLPKPLLTIDQVRSLETNNILSGQYKTLADLKIKPTSLDVILPTYLDRFRKGGRFETKDKT